MRLCEHPDFDQAILRAAEYFESRGLREAIIEKDYFVTEVLRIIAQVAGDRVIFKGGTSLSKGWNLIQRFSEDIDIFLDPTSFEPPLGKNAIDRELKKLRNAIEEHPALTFVDRESVTIGGFGRNDRFAYAQRFAATGEIRNQVLVEAGTASGREPTARIQLNSYLAQFLAANGLSLGATDESPFEMRLLHFRRAFVEKLFAIHAKVETFKETGRPIAGYARHYYDIYCLAEQPDVLAMLRSPEYQAIKTDYDRISTKSFPKSYLPPPRLTFAHSDAFFPPSALRNSLSKEFEAQCRILCFGPTPTWDDVQSRLMSIRTWL